MFFFGSRRDRSTPSSASSASSSAEAKLEDPSTPVDLSVDSDRDGMCRFLNVPVTELNRVTTSPGDLELRHEPTVFRSVAISSQPVALGLDMLSFPRARSVPDHFPHHLSRSEPVLRAPSDPKQPPSPSSTTTTSVASVDAPLPSDWRPRVLPPAPFPLNLRTTFYSSCEATVVFEAIVGLLTQQSIDHRPKAAKSKISGVLYHQHSAIRFSVNFYLQSEQQLVVEFLRHCGDFVRFDQFYWLVTDKLEHLISETAVPKSTRIQVPNTSLLPGAGAESPAVPLAALSHPASAGENPCVRALLEMARSPCVDVQREGLRAIAFLSGNAACIGTLLRAGLLSTLQSLVDSDDLPVSRFAVVIVAHVARHPQHQHAVVEHGLVPKLIELAGKRHLLDLATVCCNSNVLEILRHCTMALAEICVCHALHVVKLGGLQALSNLSQSRDRKLKTCALQGLNNISSRHSDTTFAF